MSGSDAPIADHFSNRRLECAPGNEIGGTPGRKRHDDLDNLGRVRSVLRPSAFGDRANTENGACKADELWATH
jgi:hypothetical protein